ncbi:MAG: TonB-dependent receptor plug domain-containing protein [Terrimonas sp.]|nr:TonB-dependent receptor plug domain-containing protein [Terrimonas sp.]
MFKRSIPLIILLISMSLLTMAQVTTSSLTGKVKTDKNEPLVGASVTLTHIPTKSVYTTISRKDGRFDFGNINPGGPYTLEISFTGFDKMVKEDIYIGLGETSRQDITMGQDVKTLSEVVLAAGRRAREGAKGGAETSVGRDKMTNLPTVGRNISDYLRYVPQAKITGDGGISLAGQNNRYNSFYIDGAVNNDVFGLSASGTNGGQAGIAPISIDAIDQFQVVLSPYDASLGNFTGGGINAITRSGTNEIQGSAYYFFRNQDLSGKTPGVDKSVATKLANFTNKTYGFRVGFPIVKNKIFLFLNGEVQRDTRPQPFDFSTYNGTSSEADIQTLTNYLGSQYGYSPGGYLDNAEKVNSNRIVSKLDWNLNSKNKLSLSYRYNQGERYNTSRSSNSTINFYNNGYLFPSTTHSGSAELNSRFNKGANNKLLLTFTNVTDDRGAIGDPFPRVTINDGSGRLVFGTEEFSTGNLLKQNNYALFDVFKFYKNNQTLSIGTDNELSNSTNIFIRQNYGSYVFPNLTTFLNGGMASTYNRSYSLLDPGKSGDESVNAAAKFNTLRLGVFVNDEIKVDDALTINIGLRLDNTKFLTTPKTDEFFNDSAVAKISQYYDMKGARSGQISSPKWSLNPRFGFVYKLPKHNMTVRGGAGLFTGRVPLVWPGGVYNNNGISLAGISRSNVAFRPDPFDQYVASDFGINVPRPSGQIDLIAKDFKMNKVARTSLAVEKLVAKNWKFTIEGIYTSNINEIDYKRIDILPPTLQTVGADVRHVYPLSGNFTAQIPFRSNGTNPYTGVYLLSNNEDGKKGHSYSLTFSADKAWSNGFAVNANYTLGHSKVRNEGTSSQNNSQWRYMETVYGRNFIGQSTSDYDLGSRISVYVAKKFTYANNKLATTVSLVYNGQSGSPYSYVLNRGLIRDLDNFETNDLAYIPKDASEIIFVQNGSMSPADQWNAFNQYVENDKYLKTRRGKYTERNGARLPFTNIVDLKLQQDFNIKLGAKTYQVQVTYDVFNFTNMLNNKWGKAYFMSNDQYILLDFQGYVSSTDLTPLYKFTAPASGTPYNISDGVFNSARWSSQLGLRLNF